MAGSIHRWLEEIKPGYGERFLGAFEEVGVEDFSDLLELGSASAFKELEAALQSRGAKLVQLQKIRKALVAAAASPALPAAAPAAPQHAAKRVLQSMEESSRTKLEKPLTKNVFGLALPLPKAKAPVTMPSSPMGYSLMQAGDGPRIYVVPGLDGDVNGAGGPFRRVAALLASCQVVALEYNEEAKTCGTLPALAALLRKRIVAAHGGGGKGCYVAGYGLSCVLAYELALQMQEEGQVGLLLFGGEVTWPAKGGERRMGAYEWLGGGIEAALAVARRLGDVDFAEGEVRRVLEGERDVSKVQMRVYWKCCGPRNVSLEDFQREVSVGGRNMEVLRAVMEGYEPKQSFGGFTLLLLAPESPEFEAAREVNARHCVVLKALTVPGAGSFYDMLEGAHAAVVAGAVLSCLREQGEAVAAAPAMQVAPQLAVAAQPAVAAPQPAAASAALLPSVTQDDMKRTLLGLVNGIAMETVGLDDNLMDSGFDSISLSLFVQQIQLEFEVQLNPGTIMELETVGNLLRHLTGLIPSAAAPAITSPVAIMPTPQPEAAVSAPASTQGLETLQPGKSSTSPSLYMVHGIDGDIWGVGQSYRALAPLLEPCHCAALACDDEALACKSLPELAALYNKRLLEDLQKRPGSPLVVVGYSMGCVIAHNMALQLKDTGRMVELVMVDFEITWPPEPTTKRIGGYNWLGGDFEAPLLIARGLGLESQMWSASVIEQLMSTPVPERNAALVQALAYEEIAKKRKGFRLADFNTFVAKGSRNMDSLHAMAGEKWQPPAVFDGEALLVLAPDSPENTEPAMRINGEFCSKLRTAQGLGTHYNILTAEKAPATAQAILSFLHGNGHAVPKSLTVEVKGMECLHAGENGPRIYMVHGIDCNLYGVGMAYRSLAPMLHPCTSFAFDFDAEAQRAENFRGLCELYCRRIWQDAQFHPEAKKVVMGYSMGCVIAHGMALVFQELGVDVTLVLIDFEISWPPEPTMLRIGGYEWLGGEVEAALLVARSMGKTTQQWTAEQTVEYTATSEEQRDAVGLMSRICTKLVGERRGFTLKQFEVLTVKGGACMQRLHEIMGVVQPAGVFNGKVLMILAPESPENTEPALKINGSFCKDMTTVYGEGTHYNIIQQDKAGAVAAHCLGWFKNLGMEGL